jgi:hypothetical protein
MLASGDGAEHYAEMLTPLGAGIEVLAGPAGLAATRKLLRSVFYKGMAAAIVEALEAARAAGYEQWLRENIAAELAAADARTVERIIDGTSRHAVRRTAEMAAAADMLTELGVQPIMAHASRALHQRLSQPQNLLPHLPRQPQAPHLRGSSRLTGNPSCPDPPRKPTRRHSSYARGASASASGLSESGFGWCGRFTMIRSTPTSR